MKTIPKTQFLEEMAASLSITRSEAERFYEIFHKMIYQYLKDGYQVQLSGFGTFYVSYREPRLSINPRTGLPITIPKLNVAKFRAGEGFKDAVKLK